MKSFVLHKPSLTCNVSSTKTVANRVEKQSLSLRRFFGLSRNPPQIVTKSYVFNSVLLPSDLICGRETVLVEMPCDLEEAIESQCSWGKSSIVESRGAFHLSRDSGWDANRKHVSTGKFPGISGILKT